MMGTGAGEFQATRPHYGKCHTAQPWRISRIAGSRFQKAAGIRCAGMMALPIGICPVRRWAQMCPLGQALVRRLDLVIVGRSPPEIFAFPVQVG
jgi:hypothetical protein